MISMHLSVQGPWGTNAGKNDGVIIPLVVPSAVRLVSAVRSRGAMYYPETGS